MLKSKMLMLKMCYQCKNEDGLNYLLGVNWRNSCGLSRKEWGCQRLDKKTRQ